MICPICKTELADPMGKHRPFCSKRCQLIDLGNWLGERYAVPGEEVASEESPAAPKTEAEEQLPS